VRRRPTDPIPTWERVVVVVGAIIAVVLALLGEWVGAILIGVGPALALFVELLRAMLRPSVWFRRRKR
jgi:hypothetical protein